MSFDIIRIKINTNKQIKLILYMNHSKKSQSSVEMIILLAAGIAVLTLIITLSTNILDSSSGRLQRAKANAALDEISHAAQQVYTQGSGSKTSVFITMPDNMVTANISGNVISITYFSNGNTEEVYRKIDFTIEGNLPSVSGNTWAYLSSANGIVAVSVNSSGSICGNNITETSEQCDGSVHGASCVSLGYANGTLSCTQICTYYTSSCIPFSESNTSNNTNTSELPINQSSQSSDYPEIIYSDWEWPQRVLVLNGKNGTIKYTSAQLSYYPDRVSSGDLNLDGIGDFAAGKTDSSTIYGFNGTNGSIMWTHVLSTSGDGLKSNIIIEDGKVYLAGKKKKLYKLNGANGSEIWKSSDFSKSNIDSIALGKFNSDAYIDIAVTDIDNKDIAAYSGLDGSIIWTHTLSGSAKVTSRLLTGDINNDEYDEIFAGANNNKVYLINGSSGAEIWLSQSIGQDVTYISLGDFNSDAKIDVAAMDDWQNYIYAFYGKNGSLMWQHDANWENAYALESADLNNDSYSDVIYGNADDKKYVALNGKNGTTIYISAQNSDEITSIAISDINLDGIPDIISGGWDKNITAFYGNNGTKIWTFTSTENTNSNIATGQVGN